MQNTPRTLTAGKVDGCCEELREGNSRGAPRGYEMIGFGY